MDRFLFFAFLSSLSIAAHAQVEDTPTLGADGIDNDLDGLVGCAEDPCRSSNPLCPAPDGMNLQSAALEGLRAATDRFGSLHQARDNVRNSVEIRSLNWVSQ